MFLNTLSQNEKNAFYKLAKDFISVDEKVTKEEENIVKHLCADMGLDPTTSIPEMSQKEIIEVFDSRKSKASVLLEILGIAHVDGEYADQERKFVLNLAKKFGIEEVELVGMENWVLRQIALTHEATEFWNEIDDIGGK